MGAWVSDYLQLFLLCVEYHFVFKMNIHSKEIMSCPSKPVCSGLVCMCIQVNVFVSTVFFVLCVCVCVCSCGANLWSQYLNNGHEGAGFQWICSMYRLLQIAAVVLSLKTLSATRCRWELGDALWNTIPNVNTAIIIQRRPQITITVR